jgi:hypothetical protein
VAEIVVRTDCGIPISAVETFRSIVNSTMKIAVEETIISGLYRFCAPSDHPRITGRTGRTHGARTLRIQERNEIMRRDMG